MCRDSFYHLYTTITNAYIDAIEDAGEVIAINFQRLHLILPAEEEYVELDEPLTEYPTV